MISVFCVKCHQELFTPGAVILSPPMGDPGLVQKFHLCGLCWQMVSSFLGSMF